MHDLRRTCLGQWPKVQKTKVPRWNSPGITPFYRLTRPVGPCWLQPHTAAALPYGAGADLKKNKKTCKVGLMARANVPSNGCPQIIEDASYGSLQSGFARNSGQRHNLLAARSAAPGVSPGGINGDLPDHLCTAAVWACLSASARR